MKLTGADKRVLRALGNRLKPVIHVGKSGVSPDVVAAVHEAHLHQELLKIRILENCPSPRKTVAVELESETGSALVQVMGRTVLLYRRHPKEPKIALPSKPLPKPPKP